MIQGLQVIRSVPITPASLVGTSVPEDDYPVFSLATTYADKARVILDHNIWESLKDANIGNAPATSPDAWQLVGPTNRWKAFDLSTTTKTVVGSSAWYELTPGQAITHAVVLGLEGISKVKVSLDVGPENVYTQEKFTGSSISESTWWAWTFEPRVPVEEAIFAGIPARPDAVVRFEFTGGPGSGVGVITYGTQRAIGNGLKLGARLGIQDFSRKERNDYGDTFLVQRAYAKEASFAVEVPNSDISNVYSMLATLRATPCLWIGYERYRLTTVWGFYRNFDITIAYYDFSEVTIEIEGLT